MKAKASPLENFGFILWVGDKRELSMAWDHKAMENIFGDKSSCQLIKCFLTEILPFRIKFVYRADRLLVSFLKDINFINLFRNICILIRQKK